MKIKKSLSVILIASIVLLQPSFVVAANTTPAKNVQVEIPAKASNDSEFEAYIWIGTVILPSGNLNVRSGPSLDAEIIGKLSNNTEVEILAQSDEWATISYEGSTAYISLQYMNIVKTKINLDELVDDKSTVNKPEQAVDPQDEPKLDEPKQETVEQLTLVGTVMFDNGNLNVRKGPSTKDEIIGKLPGQSKVEVLSQTTEWATIKHDGLTGYVSLEYLDVIEMSIDQNITNKKVIVLDPGHGGRDPGAVVKGSIYERDLVWQYTIKAKLALEKSGYIVYLTRNEKNSCIAYKKVHDELDCRISLVTKVKGDIYIAIHADANPSKKFRGTVTFYNDRKDLDGNTNPFPKESKRLAHAIQSNVQPVIGSKNRGITNQNYYVNRMNTVPSVLLELGVMTNAEDLKILNNKKNMDKVAAALVKSLNQYFGF